MGRIWSAYESIIGRSRPASRLYRFSSLPNEYEMDNLLSAPKNSITTGNNEGFIDDSDFQNTLGHLRPRTSMEIQTKAVQDLIVRLLAEKSAYFKVIVDPNIRPVGKDTFKLKKVAAKRIEIIGTSGVAVAWGLYYYLKTYCNCHVSWEGSQLELPSVLPEVDEVVTSNDRFRYYQNVCTAGYSSAWWQWEQWEKNIDWMALNGINLALAFHAQEAIWDKVYAELNLNDDEIQQHFSGPAFLPWGRMGNIRGWGGPLTESWHNHTVKLQHKILKRMRDLGIIPVLPAFAGQVPMDFIRVFPDAKLVKVKQWNNFEDEYCCPYALAPNDPLFQTVGQLFLKMYIDEFGTDNIYNCDAFNENEPPNDDLQYLDKIGKAIYSAMSNVDPNAIWLMQGWLFVHSSYFWTKERAKAFITSVPIGKMIVLDLQSEQFPQYEIFDSYFGQPFIWCMLHNFGGTLGLFGSSEIINQRVFKARKMSNSTMVGTGLTPEGINQNYVMYELMNEMAYRKEPVDLDEWFANYANRRYGYADESVKLAWRELGKTIYNYSQSLNVRGHYVITKRPSLNIKIWYWYDLSSFLVSWNNFLNASDETAQSDLFKHDLVDITRQALQLTADFLYFNITTAFKQEDLENLELNALEMLELFGDLDQILATRKDFLLGKWLEDAKALGVGRAERQNYEFNARNQITLWGPNGEIVDYATKQWSGVVSDYYKPRWAIFLTELADSLRNRSPFNAPRTRRLIFNEVELPFSYSHKIYATEPVGDTIQVAAMIYEKWHQLWI